MDERALNAAAYTLMKDPHGTVSRVFGTLIQDQLEAILASQPNEVEKREIAYQTIAGIKNASALIENMSAVHEAGIQKT